ncbi:nucleic acid/nucleotide deaminase domain-containing protein [Aspergillus homomorphus CBS 101889]|uniref:Uncharacterized protein n=1 Tax=Aspergillus homomorphus (strain CBS 101889) TaxID=1450537 RepID=A0A395HY29_ASPHC|nr:hypothetical protein BO97DRAFT_343778 [Aspergillus homomorphus CBS 101889]RAL12831.1 hypothetical protein BO97DRAFT_343778 [Aspergillus homomorphus CBS 101889]
MSPASDLTIKCAENIAITSLFHNIPLPPSSNLPDRLPEDQYAFSFDQERKVAGTLAFLAHIRGNADFIPAVCIEEDLTKGSLNVILAINKARVSDGDDVLRCAQQGFDEIFALLARVSTDNTIIIKNRIFHVIVSMCSPRILSRLRLAPSGRQKMKRPFKDTLQELTIALTQVNQRKLADENISKAVNLLIDRVKEARKQVDSWFRYQVTERLLELVESIHRIKQLKLLQSVVGMIPNIYMSPTSRQSFLNIVNKISRYWEAARFLYRTAKKVPLARKMRTVPVRLPKEAFIIPSTSPYTPDLLKKVTEASPKGRQQKLLVEICRKLGLSEQEAKDKFSRQVKNTLTQAKIHAEVQIIAYCESRSQLVLPRVICSSKDACFLCNLFIKEYGKIHTPRSHGRLYPGWRLPCLPQIEEVERRFCQSLQNNFIETCTSLLSGRRQILHPEPIESTLFTLPGSDSTFLATTSSKVSNYECQVMKSVNKSVTVSNPSDIPGPCSQQASCELQSSSIILQGSGVFGNSGPSGKSKLYSAGPLEIIVEGLTGSRSVSYHIEWLGEEEANKTREVGFIVDIENIDEITLDGHNPLYVTARGAILRLSWTSERH